MDLKKLSLRDAAQLVRQLEQELGTDCPSCNEKISSADAQCPNCSYVFSKRPTFAMTVLIATAVTLVFLYLIRFF